MAKDEISYWLDDIEPENISIKLSFQDLTIILDNFDHRKTDLSKFEKSAAKFAQEFYYSESSDEDQNC